MFRNRCLLVCAVALTLDSTTALGQDTQRLDLYGDPIPAGAIVRFGSARLRHGVTIQGAAFSPDGKQIVTADGSIKAWDTTTGKLRWQVTPGQNFSYHGLRFSPDGRWLASARHSAGEITLWDAASGQVVRHVAIPAASGRSDSSLLALAPDGSRLWLMSRSGVLRALDLGEREGRVAVSWALGGGWGAISTSGKLAAGWGNQALRVIDLKSGELVREFESPHTFDSVSFSQTDRWLAARLGDGSLRVWELATGKEVFSRPKIPGRRWRPAVEFTRDKSESLMTSDQDGMIRFWDVTTGREIRSFASPQGRAMLSPDGSRIAVIDQAAVRLLDAANGAEQPAFVGHSDSVGAVRFSPDGRLLATGGYWSLRIWDVATGRQRFQFPESARALWFSADGKALVAGTYERLRVYDIETGQVQTLVDDKSDRARGELRSANAVISPDGQTVVASLNWIRSEGGNGRFTHNYAFRAWDIPSGRQRWAIDDMAVTGLIFSPSGNTVIGIQGLTDKSDASLLVIWDIEQGRTQLTIPLLKPPQETRTVGSQTIVTPSFIGPPAIALSSDGARVALSDDGNTVRIFAAADGALLQTIEWKGPRRNRTLQFSPDGKQLVLGSETYNHTGGLETWDVETGKKLRAIDTAARHWAISPDGKWLATGTLEGVLKLWDFATGKESASTTACAAPITGLAFAPDSRTMAVGLGNTTALIWPVDPTAWPVVTPPAAAPPESIDALWEQLAAEASQAFEAAEKLAAQPEGTIAFLRANLKHQPADEAQIAKLIAALDSENRETQRDALAKLTELGSRAATGLQQALAQKPASSVQSTIEQLLAELDSPVIKSRHDLRRYRAIATLERIGSAEARQLMEDLSQVPADKRLQRAAEAALARLTANGEARP